MISNYFTLLALSRELQESLSGSQAEEVYSQEKNQLLIAFGGEGDPGRRTLCVSVEPRFNYCFLRSGVSRAKRNSVDLFGELAGRSLDHVRLLPYERNLRLAFSGSLTMLLKLYGTAESNVLLIDGENRIVEAFKNDRLLQGTGCLPDARRFDPEVLTAPEAFELALREGPSKTALASLKHAVPVLGPDLAKELLHRAGIDPSAESARLNTEALHLLFAVLGRYLREAGVPDPRIYRRPDGSMLFSATRLEHLPEEGAEAFASVSAGIQAFVQRSLRERQAGEEAGALGEKIDGELLKARRAVGRISAELGETARYAEYERCGKLIMANLPLLARGMTEALLPDLFGGGAPVAVRLQPDLTPPQNAERYFEKAKKGKLRRRELERTLERARAVSSRLEELRSELERSGSDEETKAFTAAHAKELRAMRLIAPGREKELPPFRLFTVAGGLEVWVGKNSANNDLLTMRYAKPNDLWFHVRGGSGSHTVLRVHGADAPGKEAIHQAAAIAAYYSKMRNARNVPVAYCQRKYVRKPKGSQAGTVVLERETVIFVQPRLPQGEAPMQNNP